MERTRTSLRLVAGLAVVWAGGCLARNNPSAEELAKFMGPRAERAARAPYSPPGWPLQVGDTITRDRYKALDRQFPGYWCGPSHSGTNTPFRLGGLSHSGISAPFWVGDMVFGAEFEVIVESNFVLADPPPDLGIVLEVPEGEEVVMHPRYGNYVYGGHSRRYIDPARVGHCEGTLPSHIREHGFGVLAVPERDRDPAGTWTRERWLAGYVGSDR